MAAERFMKRHIPTIAPSVPVIVTGMSIAVSN
jgi:hypothetical protein